MRYAVFILLLYFMSFKVNLMAQSNGVVTYQVVGRFKMMHFYQLYFDKDRSMYVANRGSKKAVSKVGNPKSITDTLSISDKEFGEAMYSNKKIATYYYDEEGDVVYKDFLKNQCIFREINERSPLLIEEPKLATQNWKLIDSTKKIGKFNCAYAKTIFRGRVYEAWYTTEIPISNGPWKLHGLPGLILEANTVDGFFHCNFVEIKIPLEDANIIKPPITGFKTSLLNFQNESEKIATEKVRSSNANQQSRGVNVIISRKPSPYQELNYDDIKK